MKDLVAALEVTSTKGGPRKGGTVMLGRRIREVCGQRRSRRLRAVIYLREPEKGERDRRGFVPSIEYQRRRCRKKAAELNAEIVDEFVDLGYMAPARPGLHRVLELIDNDGTIDFLIVSSRDRLAGSLDETLNLAWRIGANGAVIVPTDLPRPRIAIP